jgi:hypothetical protein
MTRSIATYAFFLALLVAGDNNNNNGACYAFVSTAFVPRTTAITGFITTAARPRAAYRSSTTLQMNLFDRFSRVAKSNLNSILQGLEDPEKIMTQAVEDMQVSLISSQVVLMWTIHGKKRCIGLFIPSIVCAVFAVGFDDSPCLFCFFFEINTTRTLLFHFPLI